MRRDADARFGPAGPRAQRFLAAMRARVALPRASAEAFARLASCRERRARAAFALESAAMLSDTTRPSSLSEASSSLRFEISNSIRARRATWSSCSSVMASVRSVCASHADVRALRVPGDTQQPRVAADLAVLHESPAHVPLDLNRHLLRAIGARHVKGLIGIVHADYSVAAAPWLPPCALWLRQRGATHGSPSSAAARRHTTDRQLEN